MVELAFLTGLVALGLCAYGLVEPFVGLLGLLVFNVAQPEQVFHILGTLHVEKICGILVLVSFIVHGHRFQIPPLAKWVLAFFVSVLASIPLAYMVNNSVDFALDLAKTFILFFLAVGLITTRRRLWIFLLCYALLLGYLGVSGLLNYYSGNFYWDGHTDRLIGLTTDSDAPDTLALTLCAALPMLAMFLRAEKWRWRLIMLALGAACVWGIVLTGSRTGLYTFVALLGAYAINSRRRWIVIPAAAVLVMGLWIVLPKQYKVRYQSTLSTQGRAQDLAYQERLLSWEGGWHMFLHDPLFGIGAGDYNVANGGQYWPGSPRVTLDAHSLLFKILGELGLFGLITFSGLVIQLVRTNWRIRRRLLAAGEPGWLCAYPRAANYTIFVLLFAGYASHDVYRSTWYLLAGISAALYLLCQKLPLSEPCVSQANPAHAVSTAGTNSLAAAR